MPNRFIRLLPSTVVLVSGLCALSVALCREARAATASTVAGSPRELVFIDAGIADARALAGAVRPGIGVVMLDPRTDELAQMASALGSQHDLAAVHLISHGAPGVLQLGGQIVGQANLAAQQPEWTAIGHALRPGGELLLYGCNVAQGTEGESFIHSLASLTSANIAASTDYTGAADLGGNWTLESRTGGGPVAAPFVTGFQYQHVLPANQVINPEFDPIFVRPGGTTYLWTVGKSNTGTGPLVQVTEIGYYNVPAVGIDLTRGHFQYSANNGVTWTTYNVSTGVNYVSVAGTIWRFVDATPSDTTNNNSVQAIWMLQGSSSPTDTGNTIIPDNPPTDITASQTNLIDNATLGKTLTTLTPVDTGNTLLGYWAIDSQSVPNLFVLTNNSAAGNTAALTLGTAALPADGQTATVTAHYYDMYQTDTNGAPIAGQGISKTLTFKFVPEASTNLTFTTNLPANTYTTDDQSHPAMAALTDGSFVVTWQSAGEGGKANNTYYGIYGQHYSGAGARLGGEFLISNAGSTVSETLPAITPLPGGRYAVAYSTQTSTADANIGVRIIEANGTVGSQFIANTNHAINQYAPCMATLTNGSFVVAWYSDNYDIKLQQFATNGTTIGSQATIVSSSVSGYNPGLAGLANGSYAMTWVDGSSGDIFEQVGPAGTAADTGITWSDWVSSDGPHLAGLTNGFVVVADVYDTNTLTSQVEGGLFDTSGVLQGSLFRVNANIPGDRYNSTVAATSDGGFVALWQSDYDDFDMDGIFGRRFTAAGAPVDAIDFEVNQHRANDQSTPAVSGLTNGLFAGAWTDILDANINTTYAGDVYARVLLPSVTVPTFVNLVDVFFTSQNSTNDIRSLLNVSDTASGQTLTWSQSVAPTNGILTFLNATNVSGGTNIVPDGTITYTPAPGYIGEDTFAVQVSDGTATATRIINVYLLDITPPTISIGSPSVSITNTGPVSYTVTYADNHFSTSTLAASNVTVNATGTAAAGAVTITGTGTTRTVTLSSLTGNGTLGISIAAGTASDTSSNLAPAAGPSATFTVDNIAPTVNIGSPSASLTTTGPVTYTVSYSDANFNASTLASANITLNTTGSATASSVVVTGTGTTRTVTLSGISGQGTLGISIAASTASDLAGNLAPAAGPSATFTVAIVPQITIQPAPQSAPALGNAAFSVTATGTTPLVYQWSKDGIVLTTATNNPALNLTNVNRASVGYYSVTVSNEVGLVASTNALLRVLIPQKFSQVLQPQNPFSPTFQALFQDTNGTVASLWYATNFFQLQGSTNLPTDWENVTGTMSITNGFVLFQDSDPTNLNFHPYRFYRVEEQ